MLARRARAAPVPQPPPSGFPVACVRSCVVAVVHHGRTCAFVTCESREEPWSSKYGRHMAAESDEVGEVSDIDFANSVAVRALAGGHCRSRHPATTTSAAALTAPPPPSDRLATAELEASTLIFGRSGGAPRRAAFAPNTWSGCRERDGCWDGTSGDSLGILWEFLGHSARHAR